MRAKFSEICPTGKVPFKDQSSKLPIRCMIASGSDRCPMGYNCVSLIAGVMQGYCCSSNYLCPNGAKFYTEAVNGNPRSCRFNSSLTTCPDSYKCQSSQAEETIGYCCKTDDTLISRDLRVDNCRGNFSADGCPPNKYVYMKDQQVMPCDPFDARESDCPKGYSCQWSLPKQRYQCCGEKLILTITCQEGEILLAGECLELSEPGDLCIHDRQCLGGSFCEQGLCKCHYGFTAYHGKCMAKERKSAVNYRRAVKCSIGSQEPYREKRSNKVRYCSSSKSKERNCPKGYSCQYSRSAQRDICCGRPSATGGSGSNSSSGVRSAGENVKLISDICDSGTPFTTNGVPQSCTNVSCPLGFQCVFSKTARNYFCCNSKPKQYNPNDGCPSGKAFLFPTTGTPLQCNNVWASPCPIGYHCVKSTKNVGHQCCTMSNFPPYKGEFTVDNPIPRFYGNSISRQPSCPPNQVQVRRYMNGQYYDLCEDRCPPYQIPISGYCKNLAKLPI